MKTSKEAYKEILHPVNCKYGAPMGRSNRTPQEFAVIDTGGYHLHLIVKDKSTLIFDHVVPLRNGYDYGGAYWGLPNNLRVQYTKDLSYVKFYRT